MGSVGAIAEAPARHVTTVAGRVVSIEVQPRNAAPVLTVRISDGTGFVDAVFLGRRSIPGMTPGVHVSVRGRLSDTDSTPQMFNPRFELS